MAFRRLAEETLRLNVPAYVKHTRLVEWVAEVAALLRASTIGLATVRDALGPELAQVADGLARLDVAAANAEWAAAKSQLLYDTRYDYFTDNPDQTAIGGAPTIEAIPVDLAGANVDIDAASDGPRTSSVTDFACCAMNRAAWPAELPPPTTMVDLGMRLS